MDSLDSLRIDSSDFPLSSPSPLRLEAGYDTAMATIGNTFGAMEIGSIITVFLFGIVTLQTHMYFERFSKDRLPFKILVRVFFCVELSRAYL